MAVRGRKLVGMALLVALGLYLVVAPTAIMSSGALAQDTPEDDSVEEIAADDGGDGEEFEEVEEEVEAAAAPGFSSEDEEALEESLETYEFQAEVSRLMDIIINSLYTKKEIFLREIISNASDALDKIRFLSLADADALGEGEDQELEIRISFDNEAKTLTIRDRGVGMTKQDVIQNLGTVARSGTAQFLEAMAQGADVNQIGQFGVGFYSVYLVADRVRVATKNNEDDQVVWESMADGTFSVAEDPRGNTLGRGTEITLFLKEDAAEYSTANRLEELVKRYSEFIQFPIYLKKTRSETVDVPIEDEESEGDAEDKKEDGEEDDEEVEAEDEEEEKPKTKKETRTVEEWVQMNDQQAIWTRSKEEVSEDEYKSFYKAVSSDYEDPLGWSHFAAEGEIDFKALLYLPKRAPYDLYEDYYGKQKGVRLYVRKVLISDEFDSFLPRYLNFVRGVVDSDDLPLNVSRETLQQHKLLRVIGKKLTRKVLELLRRLAKESKKLREERENEEEEEEDKPEEESEDAEDEDEKDADKAKKIDRFMEFYKVFGKNLKLGIVEDASNRSKLSKLLRYRTTKSDGEDDLRSLDDYVADMKGSQSNIYYLAGESLDAIKDSPFLERFKAKGIEVLYMTDPMDEYAVQNLAEYDGFRLQSVSKEGLRFGDEDDVEQRRADAYRSRFQPLADWLKDVLGDKIEKVTISNRLAETPAVLVTGQYGYSANMERIMRSQAFADPDRAKFLISKKTMEINPRHPIVSKLLAKVEEGDESEDTKDYAAMLFDSALLNSGFSMDDPRKFAQRAYRLMRSGMQLDSLELEPEIEVPDEEEEEEEEEEIEEEEEEEEGEEHDEL